MVEFKAGRLVKSLAGHDKDGFFIILRECGEYVYLVDGKYRKLENPKCKNKKHIQIIYKEDETLSGMLARGERVTDEEIKHFIQCCKREDQVI